MELYDDFKDINIKKIKSPKAKKSPILKDYKKELEKKSLKHPKKIKILSHKKGKKKKFNKNNTIIPTELSIISDINIPIKKSHTKKSKSDIETPTKKLDIHNNKSKTDTDTDDFNNNKSKSKSKSKSKINTHIKNKKSIKKSINKHKSRTVSVK